MCVLLEPVCATERQAQPGAARMPLKLRQGLNRGTESREAGVCAPSMGLCICLCAVFVCVFVAHMRVSVRRQDRVLVVLSLSELPGWIKPFPPAHFV